MGAEAPRRETGFPCGDHSRKAGCPRFFRQPMRGGGPAWFCHAGRTRLTEGQAGLPRRREPTAPETRLLTPCRTKAGKRHCVAAPQRAHSIRGSAFQHRIAHGPQHRGHSARHCAAPKSENGASRLCATVAHRAEASGSTLPILRRAEAGERRSCPARRIADSPQHRGARFQHTPAPKPANGARARRA